MLTATIGVVLSSTCSTRRPLDNVNLLILSGAYYFVGFIVAAFMPKKASCVLSVSSYRIKVFIGECISYILMYLFLSTIFSSCRVTAVRSSG